MKISQNGGRVPSLYRKPQLKTRFNLGWLYRLCLGLMLLTVGQITLADSHIINPLLNKSASEIAGAYSESETYQITRDGKTIGSHTITFNQKDSELIVNVDSQITVRILRIPVYRLKYTATEVWSGNKLLSATATTVENGDSKTVSLDNTDPDSPSVSYTSNHWHPGVLTGNTVFNTLTGENSNITVTHIATEQVTRGDDVITAEHYQYDDDIKANVWYDNDGRWLKMKFVGEDGSVIQYLRES